MQKSEQEKITQDLKEQYFSKYYGQKILFTGTNLVTLDKTWNWKHSSFYLKLQQISDIKNEDAIDFYDSSLFPKLHKMASDYKLHQEWGHSTDKIKELKAQRVRDCMERIWQDLPLFLSQYLQSKGYALPYLEYSVDTLVELKIIKLV